MVGYRWGKGRDCTAAWGRGCPGCRPTDGLDSARQPRGTQFHQPSSQTATCRAARLVTQALSP
jgi:hypothetical protein